MGGIGNSSGFFNQNDHNGGKGGNGGNGGKGGKGGNAGVGRLGGKGGQITLLFMDSYSADRLVILDATGISGEHGDYGPGGANGAAGGRGSDHNGAPGKAGKRGADGKVPKHGKLVPGQATLGGVSTVKMTGDPVTEIHAVLPTAEYLSKCSEPFLHMILQRVEFVFLCRLTLDTTAKATKQFNVDVLADTYAWLKRILLSSSKNKKLKKVDHAKQLLDADIKILQSAIEDLQGCQARQFMSTLGTCMMFAETENPAAVVGAGLSLAGSQDPNSVNGGPSGKVNKQFVLKKTEAIEATVRALNEGYQENGNLITAKEPNAVQLIIAKKKIDSLYSQYLDTLQGSVPKKAMRVKQAFDVYFGAVQERNLLIRHHNGAIVEYQKLFIEDSTLEAIKLCADTNAKH